MCIAAVRYVNSNKNWILMCSAIVLVSPNQLIAVTLYSQNFENSFSRFSHGTLNIEFTGQVTADGGIGGSKGFTVPFDGTGQTRYHLAFSEESAVPANDANPLGNGIVTGDAQLRFSMDVKSLGNFTTTPIEMRIQQRNNQYEADHGIDANSDGDLFDGALNFLTIFKPTIVNGAGFARVGFTLDQGDQSANIMRYNEFPTPHEVIPLTPELDPTLPLMWTILISHEGFGLDDGNVVTVDNFLIEVIPEPMTASMCLIAAVVALAHHARRARIDTGHKCS